MTGSGLHQSYTRWWLATLPAALVSYLLAGPAWLTGGLLAIAAGVELVAAFVRRELGDTLSEHVWAVIRGRPALYPLAIGFGVWIVWAALSVLPAGASVVDAVGIDVGVVALATGVALWLLFHFPFHGRYG